LRGFKIYSKRLLEQTEDKDYYEYDEIPDELRWKIFYLIKDTFGDFYSGPYLHGYPESNRRWDDFEYDLKKEYGLPEIAKGNKSIVRLNNYILTSETNNIIDLAEIFIIKSANYFAEKDRYNWQKELVILIEDLNNLFKEHRIGYEFVNGQAIRIDSKYLHKEVVKESIILLYDNNFQGPLEEFEEAITSYNDGEYKDAILNANKAFESTMKAVSSKLRIHFNETDTAKTLIDNLFKSGIILPSLETFISNLRVILESGLPTIRNKKAGHGQGIDPQKVDKSYAEFAIHLCGTFIVFLIERFKEAGGNGA